MVFIKKLYTATSQSEHDSRRHLFNMYSVCNGPYEISTIVLWTDCIWICSLFLSAYYYVSADSSYSHAA